jgi:hypothetical protein
MRLSLFFAVAWAFIQTDLSFATERLSLSVEQQVKVGAIITDETSVAMPAPNWSVAIDGLVPKNVTLRSLPATAQNVTPQLQGLDYILVEEEIALVDPRTRKIVAVLPRWQIQKTTP